MSDPNNSNSNQNQNGSAAHPDLNSVPNSEPGNELAKAQEQADKFRNEYLYLRAEFDNYKKNAIKERSDLIRYGAERLARDLVGVLDNFERALATKITPETIANFSKGVDLTAQELRKVLTNHGIHEMPSEGLPFNPAHHEALSSEPSNQIAEGHVLRVFQKGYKYHDKILRPAHVVVAKTPEA